MVPRRRLVAMMGVLISQRIQVFVLVMMPSKRLAVMKDVPISQWKGTICISHGAKKKTCSHDNIARKGGVCRSNNIVWTNIKSIINSNIVTVFNFIHKTQPLLLIFCLTILNTTLMASWSPLFFNSSLHIRYRSIVV